MKSKLSLLALAFLTACGGGGSSAPSTPVTPAPSISITLSAPKIFIGDTVKISWTSSNATTCTGIEGFAGIQPISGTINFTPTVGGQFKYSLRCTGAGGSSDGIQTVMVPIPPQRTSYLNRQNINMAPQKMPVSSTFIKDEAITAGHAYGDFFQDGTLAMVAATNVFAGTNGNGSTVAGRIYFFHSDGKGGWIDQTDKILSANDRAGCISPRKVLVADFNGDKKPDVFVACHGIDGNIPAGFPIGEKPRYLLSQTDGSYKNKQLDLNCYCHGASAADFNGGGFADVVLASPPVLDRVAYLKNNKDGTFSEEINKFPSLYKKSIWGIEFLDADGNGTFDLALNGGIKTGDVLWDYNARIILNSNNNSFNSSSEILFPLDKEADTGWSDIIIKDNKVAVLKYYDTSPLEKWPDGSNKKDLYVEILNFPVMSLVSSAKVAPDKDTVWFTLYNGNIMNAFSHNPYSVKF